MIENLPAIRTQTEVAQIMTERGYPMGRGRVYQIEKAALEKLAASQELREIAEELGYVRPTRD